VNPEYALACLAAAADAGAAVLCLCDTRGGSLPSAVEAAVDAARAALPDTRLGIHCHNDCEVAVANSLAAI
jgi:2-isopropylmalate synthase